MPTRDKKDRWSSISCSRCVYDFVTWPRPSCGDHLLGGDGGGWVLAQLTALPFDLGDGLGFIFALRHRGLSTAQMRESAEVSRERADDLGVPGDLQTKANAVRPISGCEVVAGPVGIQAGEDRISACPIERSARLAVVTTFPNSGVSHERREIERQRTPSAAVTVGSLSARPRSWAGPD